MYFIASGTVILSTAQNKVLTTLSAGECFGEASLLEKTTQSSTVVAETDVSFGRHRKSLVEAELLKVSSHELTLATLMVLRQLGLMNQLRGMHGRTNS